MRGSQLDARRNLRGVTIEENEESLVMKRTNYSAYGTESLVRVENVGRRMETAVQRSTPVLILAPVLRMISEPGVALLCIAVGDW